MKRKNNQNHEFPYDMGILIPVLLLTGIGISMIYSASSAIALQDHTSEYYYFLRQLTYAGIGLLCMIICRYIPYRIYHKLIYLILAVALVMLLVVLIKGMGYEAKGAVRWIQFGGIRFQPVEFAKFALIAFMGYSLTKRQDHIEAFQSGFLPHVYMLGAFSILLILQPDYGSIVIFWMLAWMIMFAGRVRLRHLLSALIVLLPFGLIVGLSSSYRLRRWIAFLDPWKYEHDEAYQVAHSMMGFGTGGIWGRGFGQGYQKLFYLPDPHTDFIFSVIGEEGGLLWTLIVMSLYLIILWRGLSIAMSKRDSFGALLALGITLAIALQAVINMGVTLSLLPTKGLTLPFLSYGGSSLLINLISVGILMNIWASQKS